MFSRLSLLLKSQPVEQIAGDDIVDSLPLAILMLDSDRRVNYLNPAAQKLCGLDAAEIIGQPIKKISPPLAEALQGAADHNQARVEHQAEKQGKVRCFETQISLLVDDQGEENGWLLVVNDVTEQKDQALAQARLERFLILFERSPDAVVVIDPHDTDVDWPIMDCNPAFCQMNGYDYDELIGQSIDIVHEDPDNKENRTAFLKRLQQEGTVMGTIVHRRKDGTPYHVQYVTSLFTVEDRELVLGIDRDITERMQAEEALIQQARQLELINQFSSEITAELSLDILLPKAAELIQESFGYPHVGLFLLDPTHKELVMEARAGSYAALFPSDHRLKLGEGISGWVAQNGERLRIGDIQSDPRYHNPFPEQLIRSELSVPIKWGVEIIGVLDIQSDQLNAFGKNDVLVLETLADQLATAIQNAELFEQTQQVLNDLRKAEKSARSQRDRAQQYLDVAGAIIVAIDRNQQITLINRKGCEVLGYKSGELIGKSWLDIAVPESDRSRIKQGFQKLMDGQTDLSARAENAIVTLQGEERIIEWQNALLRDDEGKITGVLSSGVDITERQRAEKALREREEQYRSVTEYSLIGVYIYQDGKFRYVNPAMAGLLGYPPDEIVNRLESRDIVHPDDLSIVEESIQRRVEGKTSVEQYDLRIKQKTGEIRHCEALGRVVTYQGQPAIIGTLLDITERVKAEQALRESEEQYRSVTEQSLAGISIYQDDKFRYVNTTFASMLGYSRDEIIDRLSIDDIIHPDDLPKVRESMRLRLDGKTNVDQYRFRAKRKSGDIIRCEVLGRLVTYQGRPAVIGTLLDITERIRAEEALIQHVGQLELINQVSREITAELSLDVLLTKAAELIQESFGYPHVGLFLLDGKREELMMKARAGSYAALFPPDHRLKISEGINGWVARNGERLRIGDVQSDPRYYNPFPEQLIRSELSVPIKWVDEVVGVLDIQSDQLNAFDKSDVLVLETLADQLATAIQNADLFDQAQRILDELMKAEEAVRGERDRAQQYLDVAGVIIVALDKNARITLINRRGCKILGYELEEIIGKDWFDVAIPGPKRARVTAIFQQLMAGQLERARRDEDVIVTRQGKERIIEWQNALLRNDEGQIIGTLSSGNDVTLRRKAEEHEREQRILAEALRDNAAIINSTLDLDRVLERVLDNVIRVVAYDVADILLVQDGIARIKRYKGYEYYATEEELQKIELPTGTTPNLRKMSETQQPYIIPDISETDDWIYSSTYAWARGYIGSPIIFNDEIIGFLSIYSKQPDVYQSSDAERLQAFADQAAIAIRNAQIFEQMNHYAAELEDSNERLAAYGHTIAHDLKNPLSTLLMGFEIIMGEGENLSPSGHRFAGRLQQLVKTMSRTIDGLLLLAELREDQGEIEPVDMNIVMENVFGQLLKLITDRGVRFEIDSDLPAAMGYTPWVQEVLANLISNAVKYIGQDNPDPLIIIRGSIQGNMVRYEVEDNGVGIAPEDQEDLFKAFSRFHKTEASGHGLGLSIVESIIRKLDGELGVESLPGEGSIFWFTLPAPPA